MFGSAHTLRASVLLLGGIALLSGTIARVLPKVKRDNSSCGCYKLTNRGNTRFRYEHVIDFSALKTLDDVTTAGWGLSNGWQVGGVNPTTGQHSMANENNVKLIPGVGLTLTVPGGQSSTASTFSAAEITFPWITLGGYFEVEAKATAVAGVVLGIFTMHGDPNNAPLGWQDEQDLEVPSSTITKANSYNAAGAQLTNFDPATGAMSSTVSPFPVDPSQSFNTYSISWLPTSTCPALYQPGSNTKYRFNGNTLDPLPATGYSTHPSHFIINAWTNADPKFSVGPPASDAVITIRKVRAYYDRPNKVANGACASKPDYDCTLALACGVTVS